MSRLLKILAVALLGMGTAEAQVSESRITYPTAEPGQSRAIPATLRIPASANKLPAVVVVHGTGGVDGRGAFHIQALNAAGIATLEVDYFGARGIRPGTAQRPGSNQMIPDSFGALLFLAAHPAIDPARIGITGFSLGGIQAQLTSSAIATRRYAGDKAKFTAHAAFYPVCWASLPGGPRGNELLEPRTGAPVLIQAGGQDDYDAPDSCEKMLAALPEASRPLFALKYYPDATHGWDTAATQPRSVHDPAAHQGKGGLFRIIPNRAVAEESRALMVAFFKQAFAM